MKQSVSATIEGTLVKRIDRLVQETERNRSWFISKAIESYLEELEDLQIAKQRLEEKRLSPAELRKELDL